MAFRPFFLLAALYAPLPVALWLPVALGGMAGAGLARHHAEMLLFGMIPAAMAGFMLTALPRWTGGAVKPRRAAMLLLVLWLAGRLGVLPALMPVALAAIVAGNIVAARDVRNAGAALSVTLFAAGDVLLRMPATAALGLRLGLAAVVALQMILAGRIIPALTARHILLRTGESPGLRNRRAEWLGTVPAVAALAAWVAEPACAATAWLSAAAVIGQTLRLVSWRGWRVWRTPPVLALHLAYAWLPAGFLLLAWQLADPVWPGPLAAVHAWAVGGVAVLCLGIMSSMIRRHTGRAFATSPAATACYATGLLAGVARLAMVLAPAVRGPALLTAILLWCSCYVLFLAAFGAMRPPGGDAAAANPARRAAGPAPPLAGASARGGREDGAGIAMGRLAQVR